MSRLRAAVSWVTEAGISADTSTADARYIRFLNATLLLFVFGQIPILPMTVTLGRGPQILVNLGARSPRGLPFRTRGGSGRSRAVRRMAGEVVSPAVLFGSHLKSRPFGRLTSQMAPNTARPGTHAPLFFLRS